MNPRTSLQPGAQFGGWNLVERIGAGGNGTVWKANHSDGRIGAIKFLKRSYRIDPRRYQRFSAEVEAMHKCNDIKGVLPLLDSHVPKRPSSIDPPWLVTVYATPLAQAFQGDKGLEAAVTVCRSLADTLTVMHERHVAHRDIKPQNIFLNGRIWSLGDLGLADFPDKAAITAEGERLGPLYYIAPEMLNDALNADGRPADVYSLAKVLWKLSTGQRYPLPGLQSADEPALTLSAYVKEPNAHSLDRLIEAATQPDPRRRPLMREFAEALTHWLAPAPAPTGPKDLGYLRKRIEALVQPYSELARRRSDSQARADTERDGVFDMFRPTISEISRALVQSGLVKVDIDGPAGGNASFYRAVTGKHDAGCNDNTWIFEYSVQAVLCDERRRATLLGGVNLGIKNVEGERDPLHDIHAPVIVAAGYIVKTAVFDGHTWCAEKSRLIWGDTDNLFFGQPSQTVVTRRLISGLGANLQRAAEELVRAFESAGDVSEKS